MAVILKLLGSNSDLPAWQLHLGLFLTTASWVVPDNCILGCSWQLHLGLFLTTISWVVPDNCILGCSWQLHLGLFLTTASWVVPDNCILGCSWQLHLGLFLTTTSWVVPAVCSQWPRPGTFDSYKRLKHLNQNWSFHSRRIYSVEYTSWQH